MRQDRSAEWRIYLKHKRQKMSAGTYLNKIQKQYQRAQNIRESQHAEILDVFNEDQSEEQVNRMIEKKELVFEINRTKMNGTPIDGLIAIKKHLFKGTPSEKTKMLQQWLWEYFKNKSKIDISDGYLCPRIDLPDGNPGDYNPLKYILFGVDFLTTKQIINRYYKFNPTINWIDSSHIFLLFDSIKNASAMINQCQKNKDVAMMAEGSDVLCKDWLEMDGYINLTFSRKLFIRNFTQADQFYLHNLKKDSTPYQVYKSTLHSLEVVLLKDEKIRNIFEQNLQEEMAFKMMSPSQFRKRKIATLSKTEMEKQSFMDSSYKTKERLYEEEMLAKMKNAEVLGDERYTLKFYQELSNNHNHHRHHRDRSREGFDNKFKGKGNNDSFKRDKNYKPERSNKREGMESFNNIPKKPVNNWREREFKRKDQRYDTASAQQIREALNNVPLFTEHHMQSSRQEDNLNVNIDNIEVEQQINESSIIANERQDLQTLLKNIQQHSDQHLQREMPMELPSLMQDQRTERMNMAIDESEILKDLRSQQLNHQSHVQNIKKEAVHPVQPLPLTQNQKQLPNFDQSSISQQSSHIINKQSLEKTFEKGFCPSSVGFAKLESNMIPHNEQIMRYLSHSSYSSWLKSDSNPSSYKTEKKEGSLGNELHPQSQLSQQMAMTRNTIKDNDKQQTQNLQGIPIFQMTRTETNKDYSSK